MAAAEGYTFHQAVAFERILYLLREKGWGISRVVIASQSDPDIQALGPAMPHSVADLRRLTESPAWLAWLSDWEHVYTVARLADTLGNLPENIVGILAMQYRDLVLRELDVRRARLADPTTPGTPAPGDDDAPDLGSFFD